MFTIKDYFNAKQPLDLAVIDRPLARLAIVRGSRPVAKGQPGERCYDFGIYQADRFGLPAGDEGLHLSGPELVRLAESILKLAESGEIREATTEDEYLIAAEARQRELAQRQSSVPGWDRLR